MTSAEVTINILQWLIEKPCSGPDLRARLSDLGHKPSLAAFYMFMATLVEGKLIRHYVVEEIPMYEIDPEARKQYTLGGLDALKT